MADEKPKETVESKEETTETGRTQKPTFKTVKKFEQNYGTRNFLEIALKEVDDGSQIITVSKGYTDNEGSKRYRRSLGFPVSDDMKKFIVESIQNL
jgi:hypothetical protein